MPRPFLLVIFFLAAFSAALAQGRGQDLKLEVQAGRAAYHTGDTVVVGIKAVVPPGYHLYANPLGPGIGKPLQLYLSQPEADGSRPWKIEWAEARKSVPRRFKPPIGSWVWAYEGEAFFFAKGVLSFDTLAYIAAIDSAVAARAALRDSILAAGKGRSAAARRPAAKSAAPVDAADTALALINSARFDITIDALICRTACVPVLKSVPVEVTVDTSHYCPECGSQFDAPPPARPAFPADPAWQSRYSRSETMDFRAGAPETPLAAVGGPEPGGINLGLGGLMGAQPADSSETVPLPPELFGDDGGAIGDYEWDYTPFEENRREYGLLTAIIFALLAGLALNLTPCIFPVLGVRVLSFAESARESRRRAVVKSMAFAGGIVAVFLLLAALAAFAGFSWGQQFQNPAMMVGIVAIIFLFALGMFDFYTVMAPQSISNAGQKADATLAGEFLKGAAATVMATPCGGPFLGALLAWALLQKPAVVFTLFTVMGVGMAAPYVLLASSKKLMSLLPKPGRWIEDMKYGMGFLLLIFAIVLMKSLDPRLTLTAVGICLSVLIAASINKRFAPFGAPAGRRIGVTLTALALIAAGIVLSVSYLRLDIPLFSDDQAGLTEGNRAVWQEFTPQALVQAHEEGRSVVVNFTAQWCTNCKLNKAVALNAAEAREIYSEKNILLLTADITNLNVPAQNLMHHLGSRSVPFLAVFPADSPGNPIVMRDIVGKEKYVGMLRGLP